MPLEAGYTELKSSGCRHTKLCEPEPGETTGDGSMKAGGGKESKKADMLLTAVEDEND
jgi:hypothetical protein